MHEIFSRRLKRYPYEDAQCFNSITEPSSEKHDIPIGRAADRNPEGASTNPARGNFFTKLSLGSVRISSSIFLVMFL